MARVASCLGTRQARAVASMKLGVARARHHFTRETCQRSHCSLFSSQMERKQCRRRDLLQEAGLRLTKEARALITPGRRLQRGAGSRMKLLELRRKIVRLGKISVSIRKRQKQSATSTISKPRRKTLKTTTIELQKRWYDQQYKQTISISLFANALITSQK